MMPARVRKKAWDGRTASILLKKWPFLLSIILIESEITPLGLLFVLMVYRSHYSKVNPFGFVWVCSPLCLLSFVLCPLSVVRCPLSAFRGIRELKSASPYPGLPEPRQRTENQGHQSASGCSGLAGHSCTQPWPLPIFDSDCRLEDGDRKWEKITRMAKALGD